MNTVRLFELYQSGQTHDPEYQEALADIRRRSWLKCAQCGDVRHKFGMSWIVPHDRRKPTQGPFCGKCMPAKK